MLLVFSSSRHSLSNEILLFSTGLWNSMIRVGIPTVARSNLRHACAVFKTFSQLFQSVLFIFFTRKHHFNLHSVIIYPLSLPTSHKTSLSTWGEVKSDKHFPPISHQTSYSYSLHNLHMYFTNYFPTTEKKTCSSFRCGWECFLLRLAILWLVSIFW